MDSVRRRDALILGAAGVVAVAGSKAAAKEQAAANLKVVRDCIVNGTGKLLHVHITSGYSPGHISFYLQPGKKFRPLLTDDGKVKVLSAFTIDNDLVATFPFTPLDVNNDNQCLVITETQQQYKQPDDLRGKKAPMPVQAGEMKDVEVKGAGV